MNKKDRLPLVLRYRELVEDSPGFNGIYNSEKDVWISDVTGQPLIFADEMGKTLITESGEGIDQPDILETHTRTPYGESINTATREGIDQPEIMELGSIKNDFGRTTITRTSEGIDQTEVMENEGWGRTSITKTSEGIDQTEVIEFQTISETCYITKLKS